MQHFFFTTHFYCTVISRSFRSFSRSSSADQTRLSVPINIRKAGDSSVAMAAPHLRNEWASRQSARAARGDLLVRFQKPPEDISVPQTILLIPSSSWFVFLMSYLSLSLSVSSVSLVKSAIFIYIYNYNSYCLLKILVLLFNALLFTP